MKTVSPVQLTALSPNDSALVDADDDDRRKKMKLEMFAKG